MRLGHAAKLGAQRGDLGRVDADAGAAALGRHAANIENAPAAGDHSMHAACVAFLSGAGACQFFARGAVEQFQSARYGIGGTFGLYRPGIGVIDETEQALLVARPDRRGQRLHQRAQ